MDALPLTSELQRRPQTSFYTLPYELRSQIYQLIIDSLDLDDNDCELRRGNWLWLCPHGRTLQFHWEMSYFESKAVLAAPVVRARLQLRQELLSALLARKELAVLLEHGACRALPGRCWPVRAGQLARLRRIEVDAGCLPEMVNGRDVAAHVGARSVRQRFWDALAPVSLRRVAVRQDARMLFEVDACLGAVRDVARLLPHAHEFKTSCRLKLDGVADDCKTPFKERMIRDAAARLGFAVVSVDATKSYLDYCYVVVTRGQTWE